MIKMIVVTVALIVICVTVIHASLLTLVGWMSGSGSRDSGMNTTTISFLAFPQHPADNHQVVELAGITERLPMTPPYRLAGRDHRTTA